MKEFIEEYGGVIVACILGLAVLALLFGLFGWNDGYLMKELLKGFLQGSGVAVH